MAARYGTFRAKLLPGVAHTKETRQIWNGLEAHKKSAFLRDAILKFAKKSGFQEEDSIAPDYVTREQWEIYLTNEKLSRKNSSYTYYLAFHWLKFQMEDEGVTPGEILRQALLDY